MTTTVHFVPNRTTVHFAAATISNVAFLSMLAAYFDSLPFCNSNDDALAGIDDAGGSITPLLAGQQYKAGVGHTSAPYGVPVFVY